MPLRRGRSGRGKPDPKHQHALKERDKALETLKSLLESEGNILRAWVQYFDRHYERQISRQQFCAGMKSLRYPGDADLLFRRLDTDQLEELTFDHIDPATSDIWMGFRMWCVKVFGDERAMLEELSQGFGIANQPAFVKNLRRCGWQSGKEEMLYEALNLDDHDELEIGDLRFFNVDRKKLVKARKGMQDALKLKARLAKRRRLVAQAVLDFKAFLKKKFSTYLKAWRCSLDSDGSMFIQKNELFRAVKELSWQGDVRLLWKGLDKDGSGITPLQELDLKSAEQLAKFRQQCFEKFGSMEEFFKAIDVYNKKKITRAEFLQQCKRQGITRVDKALVHGLDWQGRNMLIMDDFKFLETWRCPRYLICKSNPQAAQEYKENLLLKYPSYLAAWRQLLDRDGSNVVAWDEFESAAKRIDFEGDLAGAWRCFDEDVSGSISLRELDPLASEILEEFKAWADEEFGGVRAAFEILDEDKSGGFTQREFVKMLRSYGFRGDCKALFTTLSGGGQDSVTLQDIAFLDLWEDEEDTSEDEQKPEKLEQVAPKKPPRISQRLQELARQRKPRLPMLSDSSKSTLQSGWTTSTSLSKPLMLKTTYGSLPGLNGLKAFNRTESDFRATSFFFHELPRTTLRKMRVQAIKDEILCEDQISEDVQELSVNLAVELLSIKKRTLALRSRTMELFGKAEDCEGGPMTEVSFTAVVPEKPTEMSHDDLAGKLPQTPRDRKSVV